MKILAFLTVEYPVGGLQKTSDLLPKVLAYFIRLKKRGHDIVLVMPSPLGTKYGYKNEFDIDIYTMPRTKFVLFRYFGLVNIFKKADVIFVMDDHWGALFAVFMKHFFKIPYAHHHCFPMEIEGERIAVLENTKLPLNRYIKSKLHHFIIYFSMKRADVIFAISKYRGERITRRGIPPENIVVLSPGTDITLFNSDTSGEEVRKKFALNNKKVIVCVTSIAKFRKPEILLEIAAYLKKYIKDFVVLIVGFGIFEDEFRKLIKKEGLEKEVILTGRVSHKDVPGFIAAADVALSPVPPDELYIDCAPNKIFEYLSMHKPIVASRVPFHEEMVERTGCGLVVPFKAEAFGDAIIEIFNELDNKKTFCHKNIEEFSYEKRVDTLESVFKKLVSKKI